MVKPRLDFAPTLSGLCPITTPYGVARLMRQWLIAHFADANNIVQQELVDKIWTRDDSSKILIELNTRWKPQTTETRPAVVIKRQAMTIPRLGLGDNRLMGGDPARRLHTIMMVGGVSAFCVAGESAEAEHLGAEVAMELLKFAPLVRQKLDLMRVAPVGVSEVHKLEEASENFAVVCDLAIAFNVVWELTAEDAGRLSRIDLTVET